MVKVAPAGLSPGQGNIFEYRLRQEGVPFLMPYMSKRVLNVDK